MTLALFALLAVLLLALVFEFINGFHDTANSIATVVATKVMSPRQAIIMASSMNLVGALAGGAVAKTIASGIIDPSVVEVGSGFIACALFAGIFWNLLTWYVGLPSSSSHALIGGLIGTAIAVAHHDANAVIWAQSTGSWWTSGGVLYKVVIPMVISPLGGFLLGLLLMGALFALISNIAALGGALARTVRTRNVNAFFGKAQIVSAASMAFMHGLNDAQKIMGVIALTLFAATTAGTLDSLPSFLEFLRSDAATAKDLSIEAWIKVLCAVVMAAGTAAGGWRIIKTLGHKMVKLQSIHGFAAETSGASMIGLASYLGIPVSTTHNISAAIMGVGAAKRWNAVRWTVVERMMWAWVLTIPVTAILAYALAWLFGLPGG